MALLTPGYWQENYWCENYWSDDYWQEYGTAIPTGTQIIIQEVDIDIDSSKNINIPVLTLANNIDIDSSKNIYVNIDANEEDILLS